ncbi:MFS transporter [Pseudomonas paraeruginosa]|uniref:MFS transporter n=1 Tax=Pseudomonas paraeruginosa TaxID=2994495 RepID=UPI003D27C405
MSERTCPPLPLVIVLLALPQAAETILSPALPALARHWQLDGATSQWTMALFFVGFAPGIWLWGWLADHLGRRPALLGGLGLATLATLGAWASADYASLLACRALQGLGLATCSVTVQTSLRDVLHGPALMSYFVTLGAVLAWSPAVGPVSGQWLADLGGHPAVFAALAALLATLLALVALRWPETHAPAAAGPGTLAVCRQALADRLLQKRALLVAVLNVLVFSFYAAGPFMVGNLPWLGFGWVGLAIALAGSLGALLNRRLPPGWPSGRRVRLGLALAAGGAAAQTLLALARYAHGLAWAAPALPIFIGFGLAIPNLLGPALHAYADCRGRAGALFGLAYYLLIGLGLACSTLLPFDHAGPLATYWSVLGLVALILASGLPD